MFDASYTSLLARKFSFIKAVSSSLQYFWLDNEARLGVELYARALSITWGSHPQYWTYFLEKIPNSEYTVEVAQLQGVCWLDVKGEFDMRKLTAQVEYEILFDIELTCGAQGWSCPVKFEHNSPFVLKTHFDMKLDHLIGKGRAQISIGKFKLPCIPIGTPCATFRMYQHGSHWKSGLIMRGVIIKPVNHSQKTLILEPRLVSQRHMQRRFILHIEEQNIL